MCEANPLPYIAKLSWIDGNQKLCKNGRVINDSIKARKKWDKKNDDKKLELIVKVLFLIRNSYTHTLTPYTSVQDKMPDTIHFNIDRGDDIYLWDENIAISFRKHPSTYYFKKILMMALKKYILNKSEQT